MREQRDVISREPCQQLRHKCSLRQRPQRSDGACAQHLTSNPSNLYHVFLLLHCILSFAVDGYDRDRGVIAW